MRKAAVYSLCSTEMQNERSCEDQIELCREYAKRHDLTVTVTYEDKARSGASTANRVGYKTMMTAALSPRPPFDVILVEAFDRLWRSAGEQQVALHDLWRGIEVTGCSYGISTEHEGADTQIALQGVFNEQFIQAVRRQTIRGLDSLAKRGLSTGGRVYGYRAVAAEGETGRKGPRKRLVIDEAEAAVVRRIYREYAEGYSPKRITYRLNAEAVPYPMKPTRRGPIRKGWAVASIRFMLRNERYMGRVTWNKRWFQKNPRTGKRVSRPRPEAQWRVEARPDLRIVPPELEQAVAERIKMLTERYGAGREGKARGGATRSALTRHYLLTGFMRCGVCNSRMAAHTTTRKKGASTYRWAWYYCPTSRTKGPTVCTHTKRYRKDTLEMRLQKRAAEAMTRKSLVALTEAVNAALRRAVVRASGREDELYERLDQAKAEQKRWLDAIGSGADTFQSVREKLAAVEQEIVGLTAELERARFEKRSARTPTAIDPRDLRTYLRGLRRAIKTDVPTAKTMILRLLDGDLVLTPGGTVNRPR